MIKLISRRHIIFSLWILNALINLFKTPLPYETSSQQKMQIASSILSTRYLNMLLMLLFIYGINFNPIHITVSRPWVSWVTLARPWSRLLLVLALANHNFIFLRRCNPAIRLFLSLWVAVPWTKNAQFYLHHPGHQMDVLRCRDLSGPGIRGLDILVIIVTIPGDTRWVSQIIREQEESCKVIPGGSRAELRYLMFPFPVFQSSTDRK